MVKYNSSGNIPVFGNGKCLGVCNDGSNKLALFTENSSLYPIKSNSYGYGKNIGVSGTTGVWGYAGNYYGVVTKTLAGSNPEYSGLIVSDDASVQLKIYKWIKK